MSAATPADIAKALLIALERAGYLDHPVALVIVRELNQDSIYINNSGNEAISKPVLTAFNKLTKDTVVWDRGELHWRKRLPDDAPGRLQN